MTSAQQTLAPPITGPSAGALPRPVASRRGPEIYLIWLLWILVLFEPEWFVAQFGARTILSRIPTILDLPLLVLLFLKWDRRALHWPLLGFFALVVLSLFTSENRGLVMMGFKPLYHLVLVFLGTACFIKRPKDALPIVLMYGTFFLWLGIQGLRAGRVSWHTDLGNEDAFGPLMGIGAGLTYFFALGCKKKWWRVVFLFAAAVCVIGVVSSFARGAVLALGLALFMILLRSPRKKLTLALGIVGLGFGVIASSILHPGGAFLEEMQTITEGTESGTSGDRWILWNAGWEVFLTQPVLGTGAYNFGVNATMVLEEDPSRGLYHDPDTLYGRSMHNTLLQVLVESGLVGFTLFLTIIGDYMLRLRRMRKRGPMAIWARDTRGVLDLKYISLGFEVAMIAYLGNCMFYGILYIHWFWSMVAAVYMLSLVTGGRPPPRPSPPGHRPPAPPRRDSKSPSAKPASLGGGLIQR